MNMLRGFKSMDFSVDFIRKDFPIFSKKVNGNSLIYLDNAASAQKPISVIEKEKEFLCYNYASVHRGIHTLSIKATEIVENVRKEISNFIQSSCTEEIIFVRGSTEGINLIANSCKNNFINFGDNIIITQMEHHSNILPWYFLSSELSCEIRVLPIGKDGKLILDTLEKLIDSRTKLFSFTHLSNVLGTINPAKEIISYVRELSKKRFTKILVLLDGSQSIAHQMINVQDLDCDFYVFSAHKLYGPTGIGVLYGKKELLDKFPPWQGGGSMINGMSIKSLNPFKIDVSYETLPWKFEAGTPNISGIVGLGEALRYIQKIGYQNIYEHENSLMQYANYQLKKVKSLKLYGTKERIGMIAFNLGDYHAYDVGSFLDDYSIAIRTGHHCALPLMHFYKVSSMCRISFAIYNTKREIDILVEKLQHIEMLLS